MSPVERSPSNAAEALLAAWMEQLLEDHRAGREIDWERLAAEHPALAGELMSLWPVLVSLDDRSSPRASRPILPAEAAPGQAIGDFRIIRFIGRGGMGVVYLAEQLSLQRTVALKLLPLAGCLDERQLKRFKNEARAASMFHHPHIVPVYSVGEDRGVHYFAMKYVPGRDLAKIIAEIREARAEKDQNSTEILEAGAAFPRQSHCETVVACATERDANSVPSESIAYFRWAARLSVQAARALQHAHEEGIVHRDIKPANLIVQSPEHLWVTDFGLAMRPTGEALTLTGSVPGTIRYMSPEQATGGSIDFRTDIYSLGVTLYELLTLRPAFESQEANKLLNDVIDKDPPEPRTIDAAIPEPLERIVLKAIRKEPEERYATAVELAADLERYLEAKPVLARRATYWERTLRWHRRRPRTALAMLAGFAGAALLLAVVSLLLTRAYRAEADAHRSVSKAQAEAHRHLERLQREVFNHQLARAADAAEINTQDASILLWDQERCPAELRDFTWGLLNRRTRTRSEIVARHPHGLLSIALAPDESLLAAGGKSNEIMLVNARTNETVLTLIGHTDWVTGVAFLRDGKSLASASRDGTVRIWDVTGGDVTTIVRPENGRIEAIAVAPDGSQIAIGGSDGTISAWNTSDWACTWSVAYSHDPVLSLAYSHDSKRLASGSIQSWVRLLSPLDGLPLGSQHVASRGAAGLRLFDLAFSPDDAVMLLSTSGNFTIDLDAQSLSQRRTRNAAYTSWAAAPLSSEEFVAACDDGVVRIVDAATGGARALLTGHDGPVRALCLTSDAATVYSAGEDGTVRRWQKDFTPYERAIQGGTPGSPCVAMSPSGDALAVAGEEGRIQIWDAHSLSVVASWRGHDDTINAVAFAPKESLLVTVSKDHTAKAWDWRNGRLLATIFESTHWLEAAVFAPDGQYLYLSGRDAAIRRFRVSDWGLDATWTGHSDRVWGLALSPDGRWLASASRDRTFRLWDVSTGANVWTQSHREPVGAVAFASDGLTLAAASSRSAYNATFTGEIGLWDVATRRCGSVMRGHGDEVNGIAFSRDGRTFISTSADRTVRLWDASSGEERAVLRGHEDWVYGVAISPDSKSAFTVSKDRTLIAWRADSLQSAAPRPEAKDTPPPREAEASPYALVATLQSGSRGVSEVALSGNGRLLAASDVDRVTTIWNVADRTIAAKLTLPEIAPAHDLTFSPDSRLLAISSGAQATRLWDLGTHDVIVAPRSVGCGGGIVFSASGRYFASTNYLGHLQVFDIAEQDQVALKELPARMAAENDRFTPSRIVGINNTTRSLSIWDLVNAKVISRVNDLPEACGQAIVSHDGSRCFALLQGFDDQILSIDIDASAIVDRWSSHSTPPIRMALSRDESLLASACNEEFSAQVRQLSTNQLIAELGHQATVACIDLSPDGRTAACGCSDGKVLVWRARPGDANP